MGDADTGETPARPSLRLVLDYAREDYHRQIDRTDSLVGRAMTMLGLVAVFVGLVAASSFSGGAWRVSATIGMVLLLVAVVLFVDVVRLWNFSGTPAVVGLVELLEADEDDARLQILSATRDAVEANEGTLHRVETEYRIATILAATGTVAVGVGVIAATVV